MALWNAYLAQGGGMDGGARATFAIFGTLSVDGADED